MPYAKVRVLFLALSQKHPFKKTHFGVDVAFSLVFPFLALK